MGISLPTVERSIEIDLALDTAVVLSRGTLYGVSLALVLFHGLYVAYTNPVPSAIIGAIVAPTLLILVLSQVRLWFIRTPVPKDLVLRLTGWFLGGVVFLGAGFLVYASAAFGLLGATFDPMYALLNWGTVGGVFGLLVGWYDAKQAWQSRQQRTLLNENVMVLNRVLRHNIRNALTVIDGQVELLADDLPQHDHRIELIQERTGDIRDLSRKARHVEEVMNTGKRTTRARDIATVLRQLGDRVDEEYEHVAVRTDVPDTVLVHAHDLVDAAFENVLENAAEHSDPTRRTARGPYTGGETQPEASQGERHRTAADGPTTIDISVATESRNGITYTIVEFEDDGPGMSDDEKRILQKGVETQLDHTSGLGLWLTYWIVSVSEGEVEIRDNNPNGTVVSIQLRSATG